MRAGGERHVPMVARGPAPRHEKARRRPPRMRFRMAAASPPPGPHDRPSPRRLPPGLDPPGRRPGADDDRQRRDVRRLGGPAVGAEGVQRRPRRRLAAVHAADDRLRHRRHLHGPPGRQARRDAADPDRLGRPGRRLRPRRPERRHRRLRRGARRCCSASPAARPPSRRWSPTPRSGSSSGAAPRSRSAPAATTSPARSGRRSSSTSSRRSAGARPTSAWASSAP